MSGKMPLGLIREGAAAVIKGINGGSRIKDQMHQQGLVEDAVVKIIKNDPGEPVIISLYGSRLALGRSAALIIVAEECDTEKNFGMELVKANMTSIEC
jgi:Fe2+ transport system protein FeoA